MKYGNFESKYLENGLSQRHQTNFIRFQIENWTRKAMVDKWSPSSDGTCENLDFEVFESSFDGFQVAGRV